MPSVQEYPTERIRNIAVLGHGGSGKSTLVDALCFVAGTSKRRGNPADGHALTMHTPEELAHGISIQLTPAFAEHMDTKVNLLDTPGYLDFTGEALSAVRVADAAVIVVSATAGVEVPAQHPPSRGRQPFGDRGAEEPDADEADRSVQRAEGGWHHGWATVLERWGSAGERAA